MKPSTLPVLGWVLKDDKSLAGYASLWEPNLGGAGVVETLGMPQMIKLGVM